MQRHHARMRLRTAMARAVCLTIPTLCCQLAPAQTSGSWIGGPSATWQNPLNWSPGVPDNGGVATLVGDTVRNLTNPGTVTLSEIHIAATGNTNIGNGPISIGTITLIGAALLDVPYSRPEVGSGGANSPFGHSIGNLVSATQVTKIGAGDIRTRLASVNALNIVAGRVSSIDSGTLTLALTLNAGTFQTGDSNGLGPDALNGSINVGANGGTFRSARSALNIYSSISGSGTLNFLAPGATSNVANPFTGNLRAIGGGSFTYVLAQQGALVNATSIFTNGKFWIDNSAIAISNRLGANTAIHLSGGTMEFDGNATSTLNEQTGTLFVDGGSSQLYLRAIGNRSTQLTFNSLSRDNTARGSIHFRSTGTLGVAAGNGVANVFFTNPPALAGSGAIGTTTRGVIPFAWASGVDGFDPKELVTYDPTLGVRALLPSEYVSTMPSGVSNANVRIGDIAVISTPTTINSLSIKDTATVANISGSATLTIRSGLMVSDVFANATISAPVNFGAAEGLIALDLGSTISGPISGTNGITIASDNFGPQSLKLTGNSTYTGRTTIAADVAIGGSVMPGVPGPLGADTSPIMLGPGAPTLINGSAGSIQIARGITVRSDPASVTFFGPQLGENTNTPQPMNVTGNVVLDGPLSIRSGVTISGNITGSSRRFIFSGGTATLSSNNTFSGGLVMQQFGASLNALTDTALGSGSLAMAVNAMLIAQGGARTFANPIAIVAPASIVGTSSITLNGPISINTDNTSNVASLTLNAPTVTFNGPMSLGGTTLAINQPTANLVFNGAISDGSLNIIATSTRLAGANTYWGTTSSGTSTAPGRLIVASDTALGRATNGTFIQFGSEIAIDGGVTVAAEPLSIDGTIRNLSGSNHYNGPVTATSGGTLIFAVDSATLSMGGTLTTLGVIKLGPGQLNLNVLRTGSVTISQGTLMIVSNGTSEATSDITSLTIAGGSLPTATMDLSDNDAIVRSPLFAVLRSQIATARHAGAWDGQGITSDAARTNSLHNTTLGLITGTEFHTATGAGGTFDGLTVNNADALIKYTYYGDTDLNGVVNFDDYARIDAGFNNGGSDWLNGDFNYDGVVNFDDYALIDLAFNTQSGVLGTRVVPEPAATALLSLSIFAGLRRAPRIPKSSSK